MNRRLAERRNALLYLTMQKDASSSQSISSAKPVAKPLSKNPPAFSIDSLDPTKPLGAAGSCLEFLLASFCQQFSLKPKQAAGLLTQDGKYLIYVLSKGLKGRHEPIVQWYQSVYGSYQPLLALMLKEEASGAVPFVLGALHGGLFSRSLETVQWACRVLVKFSKELQDHGALPAAWDWFVDTGLDACLSACGRFGPDIKGQVVLVFVQFAHNNFAELFTIQLRNRLSPAYSYLVSITEFLPALCELRSGKQELLAEGVLDFWVDLALKETDQRRGLDQRSAALYLLCELWTRFPAQIEAQEELTNTILFALKRAARASKSSLMHITTITKMFGLLDHFSQDRNAYAPIIYKTLTFALVENYESTSIREFILDNFAKTFRTLPEMPVGILLDPYLKQIQLSQEMACNLSEIQFFWEVGRHPRLGLKNAVQVLDILARCVTSHPIYIHAINPLFREVIDRFSSASVMQDFLYQFMKQLLILYIQNESQWSNSSIDNRVRLDLIRLVAEASKKTDPRGRFIKVLIAASNEYRKLFTKSHDDLELLIQSIGDRRSIAELESDPEVNKVFPKLSEDPPPPAKKSPINPRERVQADIELAKQKREQLAARTLMQQKIEEEKVDRKLRTFKKQFELKRITMDQGLLLRQNSLDTQKSVFSFDLSEESADDQEGVHAIMRKYSRVLKLLYQKYSSSGYRHKEHGTFDKQVERLSQITEPEMLKMLKDQGVAPRYIGKEVLEGIFRSYCVAGQRADKMSVDYDGYYDVFVQVAVYVFSKPPKDLSAYPVYVSVKSFFDLLRSASADRGLPLKFFDEPDPGAGDRDVCRKLTQSLQQNPNAELPDGYRKVTDYELQVSYGVPRAVRIPRNFKLALGLLDDIMAAALGVHILEPQFRFKPVLRAQGILHKQATKVQLPTSIDTDIKYHATLMAKWQPAEVVSECAVLIDDLIYSVEQGSPVLLSRARGGKSVQNQVARMREMKEREESLQREKAEQRRQLRRQVVQEALKSAMEVKKKHDRREKRKKRKVEQKQVVELQKREERRLREREARMQMIRDWHEKKKQQEESQLVQENLQKKREEEEKEKLRQAFFRDQKEKIARKLKEKVEKRKQEEEEKVIEEKKLEAAKASERQLAIKAVLGHRKKRDFAKSLKQRLEGAFNQPDVTALLAEFEKSLETVFLHYSRATAKVDLDPLLAVKALSFQGFKRFCTQFEIVPALLALEDCTQVFGRQSKREVEIEGVLGLSLDRFKHAITDLAVLSKTALAQVRREQVDGGAFTGTDLRKFIEYLMITPNPKETLRLLKKVNDSALPQRDESKSPTKDSVVRNIVR